jgi:hypothetical protein
MAYDHDKDKLIEEMGQIPNTDLWADVRSYDEGAKKLSIYRKFEKTDKETKAVTEKRRQVARLTFVEGVNLGEWLVEFAAQNGVGEEE